MSNMTNETNNNYWKATAKAITKQKDKRKTDHLKKT